MGGAATRGGGIRAAGARMAVFVLIVCAGCQMSLMPTPNIIAKAPEDPFAQVPASRQSSRVEVIYATDRVPRPSTDGVLRYGHRRSRSLAFGICPVSIGEDLDWAEVTRQSRRSHRSKDVRVRMHAPIELDRFPEAPLAYEFVKGEPVTLSSVVEDQRMAEVGLQGLLSAELAKSELKVAYLYIHGVNVGFDDGPTSIAQLWHFLGRRGVPVTYSWPAGSGLSLRGYNYDRESGEFTVYHLKQFLRTLAGCADLERIHILAHSRGSEVLMAALRELVIERRAAGENPRKSLKLGNVILASPDMDYEVATQRWVAEDLARACDRLTIYVSGYDKAIGIAEWLFASIRRIGGLTFTDLNPRERDAITRSSDYSMIEVQTPTDWIGHSYFYKNPAVSSDVIMVLRDDLDPGKDKGRPLVPFAKNLWIIRQGYPGDPRDLVDPKDEKGRETAARPERARKAGRR